MKAKILIAFLTVSLITVFCLGFFVSYTSEKTLKNEAYSFLSTINQQKLARVNQWIHNSSSQLEILAEITAFNTNFIDHLRDAELHSKHHDNEYHAMLIRTYFSPGLKSGIFKELFIARIPDGKILMSTATGQEGKVVASRDFFIAGQETTHVGSTFYSISIGQPTMVISTPLRDQDGTPDAVLAGRLNLEQLSAIVAQHTGLRETEDTYLVNQQNYFLTEPRYGENYALHKTVHTIGVNRALQNQDGIDLYVDYRGVPVIGAYTLIPKMNIALISEIDQAEFLKPVVELRKNIFFIGIVAALISIGLGLITAEIIYSPLRKLINAVQKIDGENLSFTNPIGNKDEVGRLAATFDTLTTRLQKTLVSRQKLEREVDQRKKIEGRLKQALRNYNRSNKELEQFAYVASHDLQEPLRMVSSYTQLLGNRYRDQLDDRANRFIHYAVDGAARMQILIQDLLAFSRISSRGKELEPVDSNAILEKTITLLEVSITEKNALITYDKLPVVLGDDTQIGQLFQNLIANGIKYCREQQPKIHVGYERINGHYKFMVKDNGIGIDPKYAERIFVIFQRLHTREEYSGTGIGLALCRRIVERHGGEIWFESEPGKGSEFFFTLQGVEEPASKESISHTSTTI